MRPRDRRLLAACGAWLALGGVAVGGKLSHDLPREKDRWIRVETANFTLYSSAPEGQTRRIGANLEQLRAVLAQLFTGIQLTAPVPTSLYVFKNDRAFDPYKMVYRGRPAEVSGYFMGHAHGNYVAIDGGRDGRRAGDPTEIIYHEYLHYVLANNHPQLPVWFNEGLAEFYSSFDVARDQAKIGLPVDRHVRWLRDNPLIPLEDLLRMDRDSRDYNEGTRRGVFYAQAWALTHYLLVGNEDRRRQAGRYAELVRDGAGVDDAFRTAFDASYQELERELKGYLRAKAFVYAKVPVVGEVTERAEVSELPHHEVLYRLGDLLACSVEERLDFAADHFRAALEIDPEHAPSIAGLGYVAERAGREAEARELYARAAALAPADAHVNYLYGKSLTRSLPVSGGDREAIEDRVRSARAALARSVESRPGFAEAWAALGFTYTFADEPPAAAIEALETAARLLPSRTDVAFNLAVVYARVGDRPRAEAAVERLAATGADGAVMAQARETLLDLDMRRAQQLAEREAFAEALTLLAGARAQTDDPKRHHWIDGQIEIVHHNRAVRRYNAAVELAEKREIDGAIALLEQLLSDHPSEDLERSARTVLERLKKRWRR